MRQGTAGIIDLCFTVSGPQLEAWKAWGLTSSDCMFILMSGAHAQEAGGGWEGSKGSSSEQPHLVSECSLGFLTKWWLDSKDKHLKRERDRERQRKNQVDTATFYCLVQKSHGVTSAVCRQSEQPPPPPRYKLLGETLLPLVGGETVPL